MSLNILTDIKKLIVTSLKEFDAINSIDFCNSNNIDHEMFIGKMKSLETLNAIICNKTEKSFQNLTKEGNDQLANGTPEQRIFKTIKENGECDDKSINSIFTNDIKLNKDNQIILCDDAKAGIGNAIKNKWISVVKDQKDKIYKLQENIIDIEDKICDILKQIHDNEKLEVIDKSWHNFKNDIDNVKKRKMVAIVKKNTYKLTTGENFEKEQNNLTSGIKINQVNELTKDMLDNKTWKNSQFKHINLKAEGKKLKCGALHPLLKVKSNVKQILLGMGFEEMPTNNWIESSFWNFDSLFQPQQHPARDAHDTFFMKTPENCSDNAYEKDYMERVKKMHEEGSKDSLGWRQDWSEDEARKNIMRTHTTAVSSRLLYHISQLMKSQEGKSFKPAKYFSIDRVFRNENLDATHLAEFHQMEGWAIDQDIGLSHLIGILSQFYKRLGFHNLKFKPAYNPYTEPSMEIFGQHPGLKKWTEVGNSGVFRHEMLQPMGFPENVGVIAWGLSLERPTMIYQGLENIRELWGHKVDVENIQNNPVCMFGID